MAYVSIPDASREVGEPVTQDLIDTIHYNLEDLNTRVNTISLAAGSNVLLNTLLEKPKDVLPIGAIFFGSLTAANVTAETDGGEWVAADGTSVSGSDWAVLTGRTTLPDIRGRFIRAKDNAAGNATVDSALDSYTADSLKTHLHDMSHGHANTFSATTSSEGGHFHQLAHGGASSDPIEAYTPFPAGGKHYLAASRGTSVNVDYLLTGSADVPNLGITDAVAAHVHSIVIAGSVTGHSGNTGSTGAAETAPRYITENVFIKINRAYITTDTRAFVLRVAQQTTINDILVTPVVQGTSGSFTIDIKKGSTPTTASQTIFQSGQLPTLAFGGAVGVTGLTDSDQNTVAAGQFIVVSITATQAKLREVHIYVAGDF